MMTAERELAAFYEAVLRRQGAKQARLAAQDWIEELTTIDWPVDGAHPNWRHVAIVTADCLASRVIDHSPSAHEVRTASPFVLAWMRVNADVLPGVTGIGVERLRPSLLIQLRQRSPKNSIGVGD
jgi:hypothetical protein